MDANFTPDIPNFPSVNPFLPCYGKFDLTTYIQGASDYEIMANLVQLYNTMSKGYNDLITLTTNTANAQKKLYDFVNDIFTDPEIKQALNDVIMHMAANGTLVKYFSTVSNMVTPEMFKTEYDIDDTNSIKKAINTGLPVYFANKIYTVSETINPSCNNLVSLHGANVQSTVIRWNGKAGNKIISTDLYSERDVQNTRGVIENLTIECPSNKLTDSTVAIYIREPVVSITNVVVRLGKENPDAINTKAVAIELDGCTNSGPFVLSNVSVHGQFDKGFYIRCSHTNIIGCTAAYGNTGIYIRG